MKKSDISRTQRIRAVNASGGAISIQLDQSHGRCQVCGRRFEAYRVHQLYCSARCRLMAWACRELIREYRAGRLPGLEAEIVKLR